MQVSRNLSSPEMVLNPKSLFAGFSQDYLLGDGRGESGPLDLRGRPVPPPVRLASFFQLLVLVS